MKTGFGLVFVLFWYQKLAQWRSLATLYVFWHLADRYCDSVSASRKARFAAGFQLVAAIAFNGAGGRLAAGCRGRENDGPWTDFVPVKRHGPRHLGLH